MSEDELRAARLRAARKFVRMLRRRARQINLVIESRIARGLDAGKARERLAGTLKDLAEATLHADALSRQLGRAAA